MAGLVDFFVGNRQKIQTTAKRAKFPEAGELLEKNRHLVGVEIFYISLVFLLVGKCFPELRRTQLQVRVFKQGSRS